MSAFTDKFGKPNSDELGEFKTAAGYKGDKHETKWIEGDTVLEVAYPSGTINNMSIFLFSESSAKADVQAAKAKAKGDL